MGRYIISQISISVVASKIGWAMLYAFYPGHLKHTSVITDRVRSRTVERLLLHIKRSQSRWIGHLIRKCPAQTQTTLEGLHIPSGLGTCWDPAGGTGGCGWAEGHLCYFTVFSLRPPRPRKDVWSNK